MIIVFCLMIPTPAVRLKTQDIVIIIRAFVSLSVLIYALILVRREVFVNVIHSCGSYSNIRIEKLPLSNNRKRFSTVEIASRTYLMSPEIIQGTISDFRHDQSGL